MEVENNILAKKEFIKINELDAYPTKVLTQDNFNLNELIVFDKYTIRDMLIVLHQMFNNKESYKSYSQIINEDLIELIVLGI